MESGTMNSCVVYFYKSNKNYFKEDYESAYICSYLKKFGNSDVFLYSPATPLALNTKYDLYFIKIYEKEQLSDLYLFIKQNSISVSTIFFYGQYCRNNYELFLGYFSSCGGVIVEDEYDTIHFLRREMLDFTAFPVFFVSNLLLVQRKKYYFNRAMVSRNCSIVL